MEFFYTQESCTLDFIACPLIKCIFIVLENSFIETELFHDRSPMMEYSLWLTV